MLAGSGWPEVVDLSLVFTTRFGTPMDAADVRRNCRAAIRPAARITAAE
jgi:hypothetical protein